MSLPRHYFFIFLVQYTALLYFLDNSISIPARSSVAQHKRVRRSILRKLPRERIWISIGRVAVLLVYLQRSARILHTPAGRRERNGAIFVSLRSPHRVLH